MTADLKMIKGMLNVNAQIFAKAADVPSERWLEKVTGDSNHLTWVVGHAVVHRGKMSNLLGAQWSAPWQELFLRGAKLAPDAQYPSPEELRKAWEEVSGNLTNSLASASPEILEKPFSPPSVDGTVAGMVAFLCLHETYHVGQMGLIKKMLGYGQTVG